MVADNLRAKRGEDIGEVGVADVARVEVRPGRDIRPAPRREIVEHRHLVPAREQVGGDVRADEAGPAGDQDAHAFISPARCQRAPVPATTAGSVRARISMSDQIE